MKVGDIVRYLNAVGGGKVTRIDGNIAYVEEEDGFETPNHVYTPEECYVERRLEYKAEQVNLAPEQIIDPTQVDHVTVFPPDKVAGTRRIEIDWRF